MNIIKEKFPDCECTLIYDNYKELKLIRNIKVSDAYKKFSDIKESNINDFYFRLFCREFDYAFLYGEEFCDTEKEETGEKFFINKNLGKQKILAKNKESFGLFLRYISLGGENYDE
ncbi:MAG TPA: hypothetical protein PLS66_01380 [Tepiditoga sp.]|jgi:hypothetical protein|nr:hypothetical protein [Tepiditoga sp.]